MRKDNWVYRLSKRIADIVLSVMALIVLSPLLLVTAIGIAISDGFPIFYVHTRVGENKKEFRMYKFRTMKNGSDKIHSQLKEEYGEKDISFKLKDSEDPRIFKFGAFIRKFGIDELPQLINIIKGDMSIVGPRPLPDYEEKETYVRYGNKYALRYTVPQGLTCYWQVCERDAYNFEKRMEMDCKYIEDASPSVDAKLVWETIRFLMSGKNEY